jgi:D-alanyl-D-alanine carboxypeptidase/D-alanyl-D-alanine-endopeptidase (penicillin-binding protein 4)
VSRPRTAALVLAVLLVVTGAAAGGYLLTRTVRAPAAPKAASASRPPAPAVLGAATHQPSTSAAPAAGAAPAAPAVAAALTRPAHAPGLGGRLRADVLDVGSGRQLYRLGARSPAAPASTAKILTAAAILAVDSPTDRILTMIRRGPSGTLVLVGGGDPTLSGAPAGKEPAYPGSARLADLAAQLHGRTVRRIVVDDSLFAGPEISPDWAGEDVPSDYASAITAVLADGGRAAPGDVQRSAQPDLAAGRELARLLGRPDLPVTRGRAQPGAATLATVRSAPIGTLVEQMLQNSDNVLAECLGRQVALAEHQPASFRGAAAAIRAVLGRAGADPGPGLRDASGLAAGDRISTVALAGVLRTVAMTARLHPVLAALPVAGWSGTLAARYRAGPARSAAGVIRAKTGTLTAVSSLAGLVHDRSGRLLAFAFIADRAQSNAVADAALDRLAARLAGL